MPRKQHNELVAGTVVLAALAAALGVVLWLGAADVFSGRAQRAFFYVNLADGPAGLMVGSAVNAADRPIGKVVEIRLDVAGKRALYVVDVDDKQARIHSDAQVRVSAGLLGGNTLSVMSFGSDDKPLADKQNAIRVVGGLDQAMTDLAASAKRISETINKELDVASDTSAINRVHAVLGALQQASADVAKLAASVSHEADCKAEGAILAKLHGIVNDVGDMTADAKPKLEKTMTAVAAVAEQMEAYSRKDVAELLAVLRQTNTKVLAIAEDLHSVTGQTRQLMTVNSSRIDETIDNLSQVSADLKATAKEVRRAPWRLLYQPKPGELHSQNIYDSARAFSSGAEQLDQALTKLTGLAKANPEGLRSDDPELQKVREQLEEAFTNFSKVEQALWKELTK